MASPIGRVLLMDKGAYSGLTVYNQLDWVRDNGAAWVCKVDGTVGIAPPTLPTTSNANWTLMAADGSVSGSVNWSAINNKPFDDLATGGGLSVNASMELELDTSYLTGSNVSYDNTGSGATSTNVQDAIDELFAGGGGGGASKLDDLSDVSIDSATLDDGQILAYNLTDEEFQNVDMPTGGHTMKPDPTSNPTEADVVTWVKAAASNNEQVASLYGVQNWSNAEITTIIAHVDKDDDTIGRWVDTWETDGDRTGWIWYKGLYGVVDDNEVEISIDFDIKNREVVCLYAYRVDDEVYNAVSNPSGNPQEQGWYELSGSTYVLTTDTSVVGGKTYYIVGGAIAIKLTSPIQSASGVNVAVNLKRQRTNKVNATIIS